jgi:hypothetical protein
MLGITISASLLSVAGYATGKNGNLTFTNCNGYGLSGQTVSFSNYVTTINGTEYTFHNLAPATGLDVGPNKMLVLLDSPANGMLDGAITCDK